MLFGPITHCDTPALRENLALSCNMRASRAQSCSLLSAAPAPLRSIAMAQDSDQIADEIACLNTRDMPATLISTVGFNCEVWQCAGIIVSEGVRTNLDFVIKRHRLDYVESLLSR